MNHVVAGGEFYTVYLRYYDERRDATGIVDRLREATRYDEDRARYLARYLGGNWRAIEVME